MQILSSSEKKMQRQLISSAAARLSVISWFYFPVVVRKLYSLPTASAEADNIKLQLNITVLLICTGCFEL